MYCLCVADERLQPVARVQVGDVGFVGGWYPGDDDVFQPGGLRLVLGEADAADAGETECNGRGND
jgi:hypothetical protein